MSPTDVDADNAKIGAGLTIKNIRVVVFRIPESTIDHYHPSPVFVPECFENRAATTDVLIVKPSRPFVEARQPDH